MIDTCEAAEIAQREIPRLTKLELVGLRGLSQDAGKWRVTLEMVEKRCVPDAQDLLGIYEVTIDEQGTIINLERTTLRRRGDT